MNARLAFAVDEARAVLSDADQDRLADHIEAYVSSRAELPALTEAQREELRRRFEEPFDPAPQEEVEAFFARHRG